MSRYDKVRLLFGFPLRHGIFFVIFALLWPLLFSATIWVIPLLIRGAGKQILTCLFFGSLISIFASNYCSMARLAALPESSKTTPGGLSKKIAWAFCLASMIVTFSSIALFSISIFLPSQPFSFFIAAAVVGYIAVALIFLYSGEELFALYRPGYQHNDRNNTCLAWAAFLFSTDLVLIVGFFTWVIYHVLKA